MAASNLSSLTGSHIIGLTAGAAAIVAVFYLIFRWDRRTRALRDERPPQQTKILRSAGYSLSIRLDELLDSLVGMLFLGIGAGAIAGLMVAALYPFFEGLLLSRFTLKEFSSVPRWYVVLSAASLLIGAVGWALVSVLKAKRIYVQVRNYRFGMRGEQAVAEELTSQMLARAAYVVFHDVPCGKWNIDHVVIGPGGIFVLETKARSKRKALWDQPEHEVRVEGETMRFPWCIDKDAIPQAKRNAEWVQDFVAPFVQRPVRVIPIVVVPGWSVPPDSNSRPVKVMNASNVAKYIVACGERYSEPELRGIIARFDERCRTLEF